MSDSRSAPRQMLLPALILAALLAVLWGWFVPRATESAPLPPEFNTWDFHNYFLPRYVFGTQELLAGWLPLWNRLEFAGMPFLATLQPAALYPPKILAFALFAPEAAMKTFLVAHYALLIGGFLAFLRSQGIAGVGALAGAAFLAFNSSVLKGDHHPFLIANLAWLPLMFWLADRIAKSRRRAWIAALAGVVTLQLLVGYPEFTLHASLLLGMQAIAMWAIGMWSAPPWRTLPPLALAFLLGGLIAGIQLAPFAELVVESQRAVAAQAFIEQGSAAFAGSDSFLALARLALLILGGLGIFLLASLPWRRSVPAFASLALIRWMGGSGWMLLRKLPVFSAIRHNFMWFVTAHFSVAWIIALGADAFSRRSGSGAGDRYSAWAVGSLAALWCALCVLALWLAPAAAIPAGVSAGALQEPLAGVPGGPLTKFLGALGGALIVACACLSRATPRRDQFMFAGVALIALGQVAAYPMGAAVSPFRPFDPPSRIGTLRTASAPPIAGRVFSIDDLRWGYTFFDRVESLFGLETSLPPTRFLALQQRLGFDANWHRLDWHAFGAAEGFLDALDVEYVAVPWLVASALPEASWERSPQTPSYTALLRNRERPGRAWVAYGVTVAPSEQAALDRLLSPSFDPRREVILESPVAGIAPAPASDPPTPARVQAVSPTLVEVEAELPRPGILVLSEAWFPGWVASVDGRPAEILRADYVLRGIPLPAGSHRVRFEYRPVSVQIGAALTLLGVCGVLGLVWSDRPMRRWTS